MTEDELFVEDQEEMTKVFFDVDNTDEPADDELDAVFRHKITADELKKL